MAGATGISSRAMVEIEASEAKQLNTKFLAAWNSHEVTRLLSLMTDDVVYEDSSWPTQMHGHDQVRAFLESTWRAVPDLSLQNEGVLIDESETKTASYWTGTATNTGSWDPPGLAPTGRRLEFCGAAFLESREGKLARIRVVFDLADVMRQLGVLPKAGGLSERLMLAGPNLVNWMRRR